MRWVRATIVAVEKQYVICNLSVCSFSLDVSLLHTAALGLLCDLS